jgi:hypothetical protein
MTKRDYERAAEIVKRLAIVGPVTTEACRRVVIYAFIDLFLENPKFSVERFREACEL